MSGDRTSLATLAAPPALNWSDALRTGLDDVDRQHQRLIDIFNDAAVELGRGATGTTANVVLDELLAYSHYHFATEADLMRAWPVGAAHRSAHLQAHQRFIEFLDHARDLVATNASDTVEHVLSFLAEWLLHHILGMDGRLANEIKTLQGGTLPVPGVPSNALEHQLIDTASALRDSTRKRTFEVLLINRQLQAEVARRERAEADLRRMARFNAMLAQANQVVAASTDDQQLLQSICELGVGDADFALIWFGRPDDHGVFQVLNAAGTIEYLDGNPIDAGPSIPQGEDCSVHTWREGRALFNASFTDTTCPAPLQERATRFGLRASSALPIRREASVWAVMTVYHGHSDEFDADLEALLEELALIVSRGLNRLDTAARERDLAALRKTLLDHTVAGIVLVRDRRIVGANPRFIRMLGYASPEQLIGQATRTLYRTDAEYDRVSALYPELRSGRTAEVFELRVARQDGQEIVCDVSAGMAEEQGLETSVWTFQDVTDRARLQQQLRHQALHDILTGLPNRRALEQQLPLAIARARRNGSVTAVGMIDLDDFKPVNDAWGHDAGDRLLQDLARRLQATLRQSILLARPGGDEFVVVIEDLDEGQAIQQLNQVLKRLHQAVEAGFEVAPGQHAAVGMSMGVALFPLDATDGDALLRMADAAMYRAKAHKNDRARWWQLSSASASQPEREPPFDAYGNEANTLLVKVRPHFGAVASEFVAAFYDRLGHDSMSRAVLAQLGDEQMRSLMARQAAHFQFLLDPMTTAVMVMERARRLGLAHTLVGVDSAMLVQSLALYRRLLSEHLNGTFLRSRDRYRVLLTAETRLHDDMQTQLQVSAATTGTYLGTLSAPLPPQGALWADARTAEIEALAALPGVLGALLLRLDTQGVFIVEGSAGSKVEPISSALRTPGSTALIDPSVSRGHSAIAQAWRSREIVTVASYDQDARHEFWRDIGQRLGVRSVLSVPLIDAAGNAMAVVVVYGAYPNQFESAVMQQFARGSQQRWHQVWVSCRTPAAVVPQEQALEYRQHLFAGGLRLHMQPVVDLRTGRLVKVEALARLQCADGQIVPPGVFLPLLGNAELDRLLRTGLDQSLAQLVLWDAQGLCIDMSLNLSPSSLLDPDCPRWVEEALQRHGIAPQRLHLELLENHRIDPDAQAAAIARLIEIGVRLSMDDLGSGDSSLQRLANLPFDSIKVDQSLLARVHENPVQTLSLVSAIVQMGRDFERDVVVEGLEDAGLIEAAAVLGAPHGQGYGLARPMPAEQIVAWSRAHTLPIYTGTIRTYLGALAFHWRFMHSAPTRSPVCVSACALHQFLADRNLLHSDAARWHAQVHSGDDAKAASRRLIDWLSNEVRREASAP